MLIFIQKPASAEVLEESSEPVLGSQEGAGGEEQTLSQGEENLEETMEDDSEEPPAE